MPGDPQTSAGWVQRTTWCDGTVPVGACTPWCAVLHSFQIVLDFFFSYLLILVLYMFPFALRGAEVTSVCFVNGYSTLLLWQKSGGELAFLRRKAFWEVQSPWIRWQVFLQAAWRVTGRGEIPALSWFGFRPEIAPRKMFKEVLEYLSKRRLRTVFVHFQQLHPVCAARPRVSAEVRGFCHWISSEERQ